MTIDNHKIVPGSARLYPAIGGGYGVKMNLRSGGELLFGRYDEQLEAASIVSRANALDHNTTVDALERGEKDKPMPKEMIEVRVMLTREEARAITNELDRVSRCIREIPKGYGRDQSPEEFRLARDPLTRNAFEKMCRAIGGQRPKAASLVKLAGAA